MDKDIKALGPLVQRALSWEVSREEVFNSKE
jgi:hypothetical protein